MNTSEKRYVCNACGHAHTALPYGGWCDQCHADRLKAAFVCPNCDQWAWPYVTTDGSAIVWSCFNDCAARGLAPQRRAIR